MALGNRVKELREAAGETFKQLGSAIGATAQSLHLLEKRDSERSVHAPAIARHYGVTLHWLLTGDGQKFPDRQRDNRAATTTETSIPTTVPQEFLSLFRKLLQIDASQRKALISSFEGAVDVLAKTEKELAACKALYAEAVGSSDINNDRCTTTCRTGDPPTPKRPKHRAA